ncbi:MAG: hypothetical protein ACI4QT_06220, partial [Kiritimatiellia bacterium]
TIMVESGKKSLLFFLSSENLFSLVFSSEIENLGSFIPDFSGIRVSLAERLHYQGFYDCSVSVGGVRKEIPWPTTLLPRAPESRTSSPSPPPFRAQMEGRAEGA